MRRSIMAIIDPEAAYAVSFMDHVNQKNTVPFEVQAFSDLESLRACLEKRKIEILLVSEHYGPAQEDSFRKRIDSWPIRLTVWLSDNEWNPESEDALPGSDENENGGSAGAWPRVAKYQSSSSIVREVMELYSKAGESSGTGSGKQLIKPRTRTIGVFSPVGRSMKTAFAVTLGQILARKKPTLLVNMEACSGFTALTGGSAERGISDILYYIRQGETGLMPRILPVIQEFRGLGYLPPFETAAELFGMQMEEWNLLFGAVRSDSTYEILLLDLGGIPLIMPEILEECDLIYMPERGRDAPSAAKHAEFARLISSARFSAVRDRIRRIAIPEFAAAENGDWFSELLYGPVGRISEECAARDNL